MKGWLVLACFNFANLQLIPVFKERDLEMFFALLERVADPMSCPDGGRAVMLHYTLTILEYLCTA